MTWQDDLRILDAAARNDRREEEKRRKELEEIRRRHFTTLPLLNASVESYNLIARRLQDAHGDRGKLLKYIAYMESEDERICSECDGAGRMMYAPIMSHDPEPGEYREGVCRTCGGTGRKE